MANYGFPPRKHQIELDPLASQGASLLRFSLALQRREYNELMADFESDLEPDYIAHRVRTIRQNMFLRYQDLAEAKQLRKGDLRTEENGKPVPNEILATKYDKKARMLEELVDQHETEIYGAPQTNFEDLD
ncbi:MAG: hypothetical protein ACRYGF_10750 [Janthinobacterium lividum]